MKYTSDDLTLVHTLNPKTLYNIIITIEAFSSTVNNASGIRLFIFSSLDMFNTSYDLEILLSCLKNVSDRSSRRLINISSIGKMKAGKISNKAKVPSGTIRFMYI